MAVFAARPTALGRVVRNLLWLGVAGLVAATAVTLLARAWWVFEVLTHFRLHYVLAAILLLGWALMMRRYVTAVVSAICGAVHGVWLLPLFLAPNTAIADVPGADLRLATINMLWTNPHPEQVIAILEEYQPDIVALQETTPWWPQAPAAVQEAYPYQAPLAWDLGRSVTLISRYPITGHQMWNGGGMWLQFPALTLDVGGQEITVIAVHPPYPARPRHIPVFRTYLHNVVEAVRQSETPVVVLGDFNTTAFSPSFQDLLAATGLRDAADGFGYGATWPVAFGVLGIPIDHVLVSPEFAVQDVVVGPETGSDHAPLIVHVRLAAAPG